MSEQFTIVIPARHDSSRLPGKPLADLAGQPMIVRVAERAARSGATEVIVATDHPAIVDVVGSYGYRAEMTDASHRSGSDRVMEVAARLGWPDDHIVINVQGDEPLVPPTVIDQVAVALARAPHIGVATVCEPLRDAEQLLDPNVVKVVRRSDGCALYFSRAPIPWWRDGFARVDSEGTKVSIGEGPTWLRHVGIYGFRVGALRAFCTAPPGRLEATESLEQLRMLEMGMEIRVEDAVDAVPGGVDTPADLARIVAQMREHGDV
jgi:3-deoxy-manno-octulosonate cytidylyltransferase (CMP-KDO synthetase)